MSRAIRRSAAALVLSTVVTGATAPPFPSEPTSAARVGLDAFEGAVLIDFETAPDPVGSYYADLGVTMVNLNGQRIFDTGTGVGDSWAACNYPPLQRPLPSGELRFAEPVQRVGFFITTHDPDDVTVTAYLGETIVGSELFDTGGAGYGGSFAGIEFAAAFDRVVIDPADNVNSFFCIDDLRFDGGGPGELAVEIDVMPGSEPNPINPRSAGVTPVAILSSADFDAPAEVDPTSLSFGAQGTEAPVETRGRRGDPACGVEDVNGDGRADLVCRFATRAAGFERGDVGGALIGRTREGAPLQGADAVVIVGARSPRSRASPPRPRRGGLPTHPPARRRTPPPPAR